MENVPKEQKEDCDKRNLDCIKENQVIILSLTHAILDMKYSLTGMNNRTITVGKGVSDLKRGQIKVI